MLAADARLRVVLADEPQHPAFARVIWNAHVAEMSDLSVADREHLMCVVFAVEQAMRESLAPDKVNLASLGNMVAHLHWHVIGRWRDDARFPASVWSEPAGRDPALAAARADTVRQALPRLRSAIVDRLQALGLDRSN